MRKTCLYILLLWIAGFAIVGTISLFMPKNLSLYIESATVNETNGDIAVVYHQMNEDGYHTLDLYLFDAEGTLLFLKKHTSDGGSYAKVKFVDDNIYIYASRAQGSYGYDRAGNDIVPLTKEVWDDYKFEEWSEWHSSHGEKTYAMGDKVYHYYFVPYPKSTSEFGCSLVIEDTRTSETVTLLEFK